LGTDDFGAECDFFHVGGHSLRATRVVAQIRARFHVSLPLAYFFDHSTIVELAAEVDRTLAVREAPQGQAGEGEEDIVL
jgi:mycobactin peptide synthetase MbtE